MIEDRQLLGAYARENSESAFAELVRRHINLVYTIASRAAGADSHLAEDIAQSVFVDLAKKAASLSNNQSIVGWLYTSTRFAAFNTVRTETRRRIREQEAFAMKQIDTQADSSVQTLKSLVEEALLDLGETDREAILLRFFEAHEFQAMGAMLGVSESGARMRVERALEKLRAALQKRGLALASAGLAAALTELSSTAAPSGLAGTVTTAALACSGASISGGVATSLLKVLPTAKLAFLGVLFISAAVVFYSLKKPILAPSAQPIFPAPPAKSAPGSSRLTPPPALKSDAFKRVLQRQNEILNSRPATDSTLADWMAEEPGLKKFSSVITNASVPAGGSVIFGGWPTSPGKRTVILITPTAIDRVGNKMTSEEFRTNREPLQLTLTAKIIDTTESALSDCGLEFLNSAGRESLLYANLSSEDVRACVGTINTRAESCSLAAPRVTTLSGRQTHVSVGNTLQVDVIPTVSPDGKSIQMAIVTQLLLADTNSLH